MTLERDAVSIFVEAVPVDGLVHSDVYCEALQVARAVAAGAREGLRVPEVRDVSPTQVHLLEHIKLPDAPTVTVTRVVDLVTGPAGPEMHIDGLPMRWYARRLDDDDGRVRAYTYSHERMRGAVTYTVDGIAADTPLPQLRIVGSGKLEGLGSDIGAVIGSYESDYVLDYRTSTRSTVVRSSSRYQPFSPAAIVQITLRNRNGSVELRARSGDDANLDEGMEQLVASGRPRYVSVESTTDPTDKDVEISVELLGDARTPRMLNWVRRDIERWTEQWKPGVVGEEFSPILVDTPTLPRVRGNASLDMAVATYYLSARVDMAIWLSGGSARIEIAGVPT
jgi:hypothetical protein